MAPEPRRRFPSASRLTRKADLDAVRLEGKRFRTTRVEVRSLASLLRRSRVGIIVPRYKHSAVARNLVKRRMRELARLTLLPVLEGGPPLDVVLRATPAAYGAAHGDLADDVVRIARRLRASA